MSVEVVEKRKGATICGGADCGETVEDTKIHKAEGCPECGSKVVKKSLVVIRKAVGDEEDNLEENVLGDEVEEDESTEDETDDEDDADEDDEDDADEDDEDGEEDDGADDGDDGVAKNAPVALEALNLTTAFVEDLSKVFQGKNIKKNYEAAMVEFNNVLDAAAEKWISGTAVSKASEKSHVTAIRERVNNICKGESEMTTITKRDDLPEDVRKSLDEADKIVEKSKTDHWNEVAKSFSHLGLTGTTLRKIAEDTPEAYEELKKSLDTAQSSLAESEILKSFGAPGHGSPLDEVAKRQDEAQKLVDAGKFDTIEKAEVSLMNGKHYTPTNA